MNVPCEYEYKKKTLGIGVENITTKLVIQGTVLLMLIMRPGMQGDRKTIVSSRRRINLAWT